MKPHRGSPLGPFPRAAFRGRLAVVLRFRIAAAAFAASLTSGLVASADEPPAPPPAPEEAPLAPSTVRAAVAVGAVAVLVPGVIGGIRTALGADDGQKTAGLLVASGGFALGPIVSHLVTREWARAAAFGAVPLACTYAATLFILEKPDAVYRGNTGTRTAFGILLGLGLLGAVTGLVDTARAGERSRARRAPPRSTYYVAPVFQDGGAVLTLGGAL